eukprot:TRINITY_DN5636_c0_g2_i1.p1 TRINITY_DN5636_c0_g2~~TRINITY_DN5636_c0_g2_i1.p1  ORF type:complete len:381 (+),score=89.23 TRINITY_DN5636_c0_g2_i1:181-1323(+)
MPVLHSRSSSSATSDAASGMQASSSASVDGYARSLPSATSVVPVASGRHTKRGEDGKVLVVTPWFPEGIPKGDIRLDSEVLALATLVQLTEQEKAARTMAAGTLAEVLKNLMPQCSVAVYGSASYGLSLPTSGVDVIVEHCDEALFTTSEDGTHASMLLLLANLQTCGFSAVNWTVLANGACAKVLHAPTNLMLNVTCVPGTSNATSTAQHLRTLVASFPAIEPVFAILRLVLSQSRCGAHTPGGLASYALLLMITRTAKGLPKTTTPQDLLLQTLRHYNNGAPGEPLVVPDILNPTTNVALGCVRTAQIRSVLRNCLTTLEKWTQEKWEGYRGRSPLSSVLAYDSLWPAHRLGEVRYYTPCLSSPDAAEGAEPYLPSAP